MYGLWYGRLTPDEARAKALAWGFEPDDVERMIRDATQAPSYWSAIHRSAEMKENRQILQIPLPGGSGNAPTGAVQFQGDWPGLFVRGDHAVRMKSAIRELQRHLGDPTDRAVSSALFELGELADVIEAEVMTGGPPPDLKPIE